MRDKAAAEVRGIVAKNRSGSSNIRDTDSGEAYRTEKIDQDATGMPKAKALAILPPGPGTQISSGPAQANVEVIVYRLHPQWTMRLICPAAGTGIQRPELIRSELLVEVPPPANFTGTWIEWYVNGRTGHETQYKNGKFDGVVTHYHANGTKSLEARYANQLAEGMNAGWYSDGTKSHVGQHRSGKQDGKWIRWYPTGIKQSETNYTNGERDGLDEGWYDNALKSYEIYYEHDVKQGIDASWDQDRNVNWKREFKNGGMVDTDPRRTRRHWSAFSNGALFVLITVLCVWLVVRTVPAGKVRVPVASLEQPPTFDTQVPLAVTNRPTRLRRRRFSFSL